MAEYLTCSSAWTMSHMLQMIDSGMLSSSRCKRQRMNQTFLQFHSGLCYQGCRWLKINLMSPNSREVGLNNQESRRPFPMPNKYSLNHPNSRRFPNQNITPVSLEAQHHATTHRPPLSISETQLSPQFPASQNSPPYKSCPYQFVTPTSCYSRFDSCPRQSSRAQILLYYY